MRNPTSTLRRSAVAFAISGMVAAGTALAGPATATTSPVVPQDQSGTIVAWGPGEHFHVPGVIDIDANPATLPAKYANTPFVQVAASGVSTAIGLTSDGQVIPFGDPLNGPMTAPASPDGTPFVQVAASDNEAALALTSGGKVAFFGTDPGGTNASAIPTDLPPMATLDIAANGYLGAGVTKAGGVRTWGFENSTPGPLEVPTDLPALSSVSVSSNDAYAITTDNNVVGWGSTTGGALDIPASVASGGNVAAVAARANGALALLKDGSLVSWGQYTSLDTSENLGTPDDVPTAITGKVVAMTTDGLGINAAVTSDGTVHFWGDGDDGSLQSLVPSSVTGAKIAAISIAGPANGSPEAAVLITKPQPAASTTTVTAPATKYGTAGHVTVKVTATGTTASGKVTLTGAGAAQTATVSSTGTASFTLPRTLRPRSYTVTASYAGNDTTQASTGHTTLRVAKTAPGVPAVKVIKKPTRKKTGKATVTVATRAGLAKATGRVIVTLKLGKKTKHVTGTLRSGRVTVKLPKLTKGKWKLSARYAGNAYYTARTSRTLTIRVR